MGIVENGRIAGYNVLVGGGLNDAWQNDYLGKGRIGFCLRIKRCGWPRRSSRFSGISESSDRRNARLKYTIEGRGVDWFKKEHPIGMELKSPGNSRLIPLRTVTTVRRRDGKWTYGLVEGGRLRDLGQLEKQAIRAIAENVPCESVVDCQLKPVIAPAFQPKTRKRWRVFLGKTGFAHL